MSQKPNSAFAAIDHQLLHGKLFGASGAVAQAAIHVLPAAEKGDVASMMKLANVYYTAMSNIGSQGGIANKLRAVPLLYKAKRWATRAFLAATKTRDLRTAIVQMDVQLHHQKPIDLGYGDVHILMSCYTQWAKQIMKRLRLSTAFEQQVVEECEKTLRRCNKPHLQAYAAMTVYEFPGIGGEKRKACFEKLVGFADKHYSSLLEAANITSSQRELAQAVCRILRTVGKFDEAVRLGTKYALFDQVQKAKSRS